MSDGLIVSLICLGLLVALLPFFIIMAMLSRIRHMLTRIEKSLASLRDSKEERVGNHAGDQ